MRDGLGETLVERQEGNDGSQREVRGEQGRTRIQGHGGSDNRYEHIAQIAQVAVHRHHDVGNLVGVVVAAPQVLVDFLKPLDGFRLVAEHLHHLLTGHHLLDEAVHLGQLQLLCFEERPRALAQFRRGEHHHDGHDDADQRQRNAQHHHRGEGNHQRDDAVEHLGQT